MTGNTGVRSIDEDGLTIRDVVAVGASIGGGMLSGAAAAAITANPIAIGAGALVGGALAAIGVDSFPSLEPRSVTASLTTSHADGCFKISTFTHLGKKNGLDYVGTKIEKYDASGKLISRAVQNIEFEDATALLSQVRAQEVLNNLDKCFSANTLISLRDGETTEISAIRPGDIILSFDPLADNGWGVLVQKKVVRTFTNITEEWLRLTFVEEGEKEELVTTPGHEFLAAHGGFRQIEKLIAGGTGTLVLADGTGAMVSAERIVYSADVRAGRRLRSASKRQSGPEAGIQERLEDL